LRTAENIARQVAGMAPLPFR